MIRVVSFKYFWFWGVFTLRLHGFFTIILLRALLTSVLMEDFRLVGLRLVAVGMKLVPLFRTSVMSLGSL